jgi:hypothetical protein
MRLQRPWTSLENFLFVLISANNYGILLRPCGQPRTACDEDAETVEFTRELYRIHPDRYRNDFVTRLHVFLRTRGLSGGATDADAEAVELTRELYRV